MKHSLLNSPIIIPLYGFHFKSTDFDDEPAFIDSRSICKQLQNFVISEILMDSVVN